MNNRSGNGTNSNYRPKHLNCSEDKSPTDSLSRQYLIDHTNTTLLIHGKEQSRYNLNYIPLTLYDYDYVLEIKQ